MPTTDETPTTDAEEQSATPPPRLSTGDGVILGEHMPVPEAPHRPRDEALRSELHLDPAEEAAQRGENSAAVVIVESQLDDD